MMAELPTLSSVSQNTDDKQHDEAVLLLDPSLEDRVPEIPANESSDEVITVRRAVVLKATENSLSRDPSLSFDQTSLEWQTFDGHLPKGAVSVYNGYTGRIDYVCKYGNEAGFYNPDKGPQCRYAYGAKELLGSPFEILVNKDNFEILEWKDGYNGSVPANSIKTGKDTYVGKNKYGLGKVHVKHKAFFLPWEGYEYWYRSYQVLTFNKDVVSEHISDVKYKIDRINIIKCPPEIIEKSTINNNSSKSVTGTVNLSKTIQVEKRWDTGFSLTLGITTSITAGVPEVFSASVAVSSAVTFDFAYGTTRTESKTCSHAVNYEVPPNQSCSVSMTAHKFETDVPFSARLSRTYRDGETTWTSITGTYKGVQVGEVTAEVGEFMPLPIALCPRY